MTRDEEKQKRRELLEAARALHWRTRFRLNRVARGWIVEDLASGSVVGAARGGKLCFHEAKVQAIAALQGAQALARQGWMPVPNEKLETLYRAVLERARMLERDMELNGAHSQRHAKVLRSKIKLNEQTLASVRRMLVLNGQGDVV